MAVLRVDLAPNRAAFGERSTGDGQARQMLFDSGHNAVDLRIKPADSGFDIRGLVLGLGFENGRIEISNEENTIKASLSETSQFELTEVPEGEYSVSITGGDQEIFIELLTVK
jgi:hypothetical protein